MLSALLADFSSIPDCRVATTLDRRCAHELGPRNESLEIHLIESAEVEQVLFDRLAEESDASLVIAPETDSVLLRRVQRLHELGARSLNCLPGAIELCGDKLALYQHFAAHGIPTIETHALPADAGACWDLVRGSFVLKPRDGAGSWLTFGIPDRDARSLDRALQKFTSAGALDRAIVQPWIRGQNLSVGCLCHDDTSIDVFPVGKQDLAEGSFRYRGGSIPAAILYGVTLQIEEIVRSACRSIGGLRGYVGFDILLPEEGPRHPLIVEINPRPTTSYVGYRRHCRANIARRWLEGAAADAQGLCWGIGGVTFKADQLTATADK